MTIGERIKKRRKELKISADELGRRIGKDRATVFRYEKGEIVNLPIDILEPIASALLTTPQYLMGWEEVQQKNETLAGLVVRMRTDSEFFEAVKKINALDPEKLSSLLALLK